MDALVNIKASTTDLNLLRLALRCAEAEAKRLEREAKDNKDFAEGKRQLALQAQFRELRVSLGDRDN